jgi:hypothetical protein
MSLNPFWASSIPLILRTTEQGLKGIKFPSQNPAPNPCNPFGPGINWTMHKLGMRTIVVCARKDWSQTWRNVLLHCSFSIFVFPQFIWGNFGGRDPILGHPYLWRQILASFVPSCFSCASLLHYILLFSFLTYMCV